MEKFIVSARKYRPDTFQTVIGQVSITTTLKNAIRGKQLAHAYLFCGPRGVGKTTCARIFAKTINCFNLTDKTEACNECESCLSFNASRSFNIHELDAASNNSVEDIRNLIDQIRIPPQIAKYSIYIIDEVHMLSSNAFNAFLKTLEEPPAHAIFILATTEKHKIIPTILSRCQIFDFNRISIEDIVTHLEHIARAGSIDAEIEGLNIIAQKADGAMRDALSIFDQIVSFSSGKISYQVVIDNLNVLDYDYYFKITEAILSGNIPNVLLIFNNVLDKGFDGHNFVNGLSRHLRDLLVCHDESTLKLLEVGAAIREKYKLQSKTCSPGFIIKALSITNQCDISYRSSRNHRLHVELCLVQLCGLMTVEKKKSEYDVNQVKNTKSAEANEIKATQPNESQIKITLEKKTATEKREEIKKTGKSQISQDSDKSQKLQESQEPQESQTLQEEPKSQEYQEPPKLQDSVGPDVFVSPGNANRRNNTISIKDAMNGTITSPGTDPGDELFELDDQENNLLAQENNDDFTEKELLLQWKKYANQIRNKHPRLYNTLLANKPSISSKNNIEFELSNHLQKEAMNKIKADLLNHLRHELNKNIELMFSINETLQDNRLYLPEDKYEHMLKKNPDLAIFRQMFNLDFE